MTPFWETCASEFAADFPALVLLHHFLIDVASDPNKNIFVHYALHYGSNQA